MLNTYIAYFETYLSNKKGQGMVEYALLLGLIAIVVVAVLLLFGPQVAALFTRIMNALPQ